jgi:glycosyltransferase involved in cell wall biosynthesis
LKNNSSSPLLIDALYINNSGGLMLLKYLVEKALELKKEGVYFLIDSRCESVFELIPAEQKTVMKPSLSARKTFYNNRLTHFSGVLCFGNIPPPFRLKVPVYTYLHNPLLLSTPAGYPLSQKVSKFLKTTFIRLSLKNTDGIFIQTDFMASMLKENWNYPESKTFQFPFFDVRRYEPLHSVEKQANEYLFINDGNPHKNHINLLKAWAIVNETQPDWRLHLTVTERCPELLSLIENYKNQGLNVINHGFVNPVDVYSQCQYLIYPSLTESFGLGLIEGTVAGLQVICSDLPYAHSVVYPSAVFDPYQPEEMAAAILKNRIENPDFKATSLRTKDMIRQMLETWP